MSSRPTSAYDPNYYKKDRRTSLETSFVMEETFFMLIADTVVSIISGDSSMIRTVLRSKEKQFLKGSMFKAYIPYDASKSSPYKIMVRPVEEDPMLCECERVALTPISKEEKDMLMALADCGTRYRVYRDRNRMLEALQIEEGSLVLVSTRNLIRPSCGIVRYKGMVSSMPGIYFGIELTENRISGSTDGLFRGKQHFKCEKNCALFVTVDKIIRLLHSVKLEIGPGSKVFVFLTEDDEREHLEPGTVKYIGTPKGWQDVHVGIELVKPVGNKDGYHGNDKLFHSKRDHALIVPLGSAMPENKIDTKHVNRFRRDMAYTRETSASGTNHEKYQSNVPIKSESSLSVLNSTSKELGQSSVKTLKDQEVMMRSFEEKKQNSNVVTKQVIKNNHWDDTQADARSPTSGEGSKTEPLPYYQSKHPGAAVRNSNTTNLDDNLKSGIPNKDGYTTTESTGARRKTGINKPPRTAADSAIQNIGTSVDRPRLKQDGGSFSAQWKKPEERTVEAPRPIDRSLQINSMVEVLAKSSDIPQYGLIRWIGIIPEMKSDDLVAGIELENELAACTDGTFASKRYFQCEPRRALFVKLYSCKPDSRFSQKTSLRASLFRSETVTEDIPPPEEFRSDFCGRGKGIQGHHNSCYLDATLFSMFAYQYSFDSLINRPREADDIEDYKNVQLVLKHKIVNPLRKNGYVAADKVMELREIMDRVGSLKGLTHEEKDPEEFLNTLFKQVFLADAPVKIRHEGAAKTDPIYMYQLFMEKDEGNQLPTVQELLAKSFMFSSLKLEDVPPYLILQMPRFGKVYKMYNKVIPSLELDVTDIVENCARECVICGNLALLECRECFFENNFKDKIASFCEECCHRFHYHHTRVEHNFKHFKISEDIFGSFQSSREDNRAPLIPRRKMELFAVVCIETSHYVAFVKAGMSERAQWCFMDSMADRQGDFDGYNIPEVLHIEELTNWLNKERIEKAGDNSLPSHIRRLLSDAYMCFYQSQEVNIY